MGAGQKEAGTAEALLRECLRIREGALPGDDPRVEEARAALRRIGK